VNRPRDVELVNLDVSMQMRGFMLGRAYRKCRQE
jgi:hypothetical protein